MSDAQERIWAGNDGFSNRWDWDEPVPDWEEYIHADLYEAIRAENERLREALSQEREERMWGAYATGIEKDGQWTHAFMSDGERLASELGLDASKGWYSAKDVKALIPKAARAALETKKGPVEGTEK